MLNHSRSFQEFKKFIKVYDLKSGTFFYIFFALLRSDFHQIRQFSENFVFGYTLLNIEEGHFRILQTIRIYLKNFKLCKT